MITPEVAAFVVKEYLLPIFFFKTIKHDIFFDSSLSGHFYQLFLDSLRSPKIMKLSF